MEWTTGTVEGLAPDTASVTAARRLARPAPWSELGHDQRSLWGLCKGSGAKPYQVQVDLQEGPAYKCSCPSRKFPCKHALALLLLLATGHVAEGTAPAWGGGGPEAPAGGAPRPKGGPGAPPADPEAA